MQGFLSMTNAFYTPTSLIVRSVRVLIPVFARHIDVILPYSPSHDRECPATTRRMGGARKPRGDSRTWSRDACLLKCRLEIYSGVSSGQIEGLAKRKKDCSCSEVRSFKGLPYLYFAEPAVLPVMQQYSTESVLNRTCEAGESRLHR